MTLPTTETTRSTDDKIIDSISTDYDFDQHDSDKADEKARRGFGEQVAHEISTIRGEPEWMLAKRLKAYSASERKPMPAWGVDLSQPDMDTVKYYAHSTDRPASSQDDLPEDIKSTYDRIGIPEVKRERLVTGVAAQYESEVVYHQTHGGSEEQGVIFIDINTTMREYPELVKEYFEAVMPAGDNKFATLSAAVWSGGPLIYVPKDVHIKIPLQACFRINTENMSQFEHTLIIADEGFYVHYVEGCTVPVYSTDSLHSAIVEIVVKKNAHVHYTTIQNQSNSVYNLVTQRATCEEGTTMEWIDGNTGSKWNMKYPAIFLMGPHARDEALSIAFAGADRHQDTDTKMVHMAPRASSYIVSKPITRHSDRSAYRGPVQIMESARHSKSNVLCDTLLVDEISCSSTYPYVSVRTDNVEMGREATVSKVSADQLFYLVQCRLAETKAVATIVRGFVEPITRELPMEYALELSRLIELQMENLVG